MADREINPLIVRLAEASAPRGIGRDRVGSERRLGAGDSESAAYGGQACSVD